MRPVWCFFGGEGGAAVLGLMPSPEPVMIGEHSYLGLLVPSAPVPFGGALIYVPVGLGQAGRRRRRAADERLCVDGRDAAAVESPGDSEARPQQAANANWQAADPEHAKALTNSRI